jgi:hypothetical protein
MWSDICFLKRNAITFVEISARRVYGQIYLNNSQNQGDFYEIPPLKKNRDSVFDVVNYTIGVFTRNHQTFLFPSGEK